MKNEGFLPCSVILSVAKDLNTHTGGCTQTLRDAQSDTKRKTIN